MRFLFTILSALFVFVISRGSANASCIYPDVLSVKVLRDNTLLPLNSTNPKYGAVLHVEFGWTGDGVYQGETMEPMVEGCADYEALELEIIIDTAPVQKCFGQPIGGCDCEERPYYVEARLPPSWYADVWNYHFPNEFVDEILDLECLADYTSLFEKAALWYDEKVGIADDVAIFAIGIKDSSELQTDRLYEFDYYLELPNSAQRPQCYDDEGQERSNANWGYTTVRIDWIPNLCTLPNFPLPSTDDCAHVLGFRFCDEVWPVDESEIPDNVNLAHHPILANRICVPTETELFESGIGESPLFEHGGMCTDYDDDGLYRAYYSPHMYGSLVRDCDDGAPFLLDEYYDDEAKVCTDGCIYSVVTHECDEDYTEATGEGAGGGEVFELCGSIDSDSGFVTIQVRKHDGTVFGDRPYQVRVSEPEPLGQPCGPATNHFEVSDYEPTGIGTEQLTFTFPSLWEEDQVEKAYCVTASVQTGDAGFDGSLEQQSWWWSEKVVVTRGQFWGACH